MSFDKACSQFLVFITVQEKTSAWTSHRAQEWCCRPFKTQLNIDGVIFRSMLDQSRHALQNRSELKHPGGCRLAHHGFELIDIENKGTDIFYQIPSTSLTFWLITKTTSPVITQHSHKWWESIQFRPQSVLSLFKSPLKVLKAHKYTSPGCDFSSSPQTTPPPVEWTFNCLCIQQYAWQTPPQWHNDWTMFKGENQTRFFFFFFWVVILWPGAKIIYLTQSCWSKTLKYCQRNQYLHNSHLSASPQEFLWFSHNTPSTQRSF